MAEDSVGGKNLSSQLQNATLKFSGKFQINVIKLIKLDYDMCYPTLAYQNLPRVIWPIGQK